jgi:hypothetical protein
MQACLIWPAVDMKLRWFLLLSAVEQPTLKVVLLANLSEEMSHETMHRIAIVKDKLLLKGL